MGTRILTAEQLKKLSDKSLLAYYKKVRMTYFNQRLGEDEDFATSDFKKFRDLKDLVKNELDTREHVKRSDTPDGVNVNDKTGDPKLKDKA